MSSCYATACSINYMEFIEPCLKSIVRNSNMILPLYFFCLEKEMTERIKDRLKSIYADIRFVNIDYNKYVSLHKENPEYFSQEAFNIKGYDKVLYLDADILVLDSLRKLFDVDADIAMTKEPIRNCYNAGVMLIGKKYLNDEVYNTIMSMQCRKDSFGTDQAIYNDYFEGKITTLDNKWNTFVNETKYIHGINILHYIIKPNKKENYKKIRPSLLSLWKDAQRW